MIEAATKSIYPILAALLDYPDAELLNALPDVEQALRAWPEAGRQLQPLVTMFTRQSLIASQENYVATFDRNPSHSLHLFEHVHGESRDRGQAMVDLLDEYRSHGLDMASNELPDYVPLFLEVLGLIEPSQARSLLDEAIHVLAVLGERLARDKSPYASIFEVLRSMSDVVPQTRAEPPVRDMDDALELFGPGTDGVEPLLASPMSKPQPVHFYPRGAAAAT